MNNNYNLEELFNKSIMSGIPSIFVEGKDDIKIYQSLLSLDNLDFDIYPAEIYVDNENGGCKAVVEVIGRIVGLSSIFQLEPKNLILGIADKDVSDYRNECLSSELIYYLKYYSIESYFINDDSLKKVFGDFTSADTKLLNIINYEYFFSKINRELEERLLLSSLECLKTAIYPEYVSCLSYNTGSWECYKNTSLVSQLNAKKTELLLFKKQLNIPDGLLGLQLICKGKWLLENFSDLLIENIKNLNLLCKEHDTNLAQCIFCKVGKHNQCQFKMVSTVNTKFLRNHIKLSLSHSIFQDIRDRMNLLV